MVAARSEDEWEAATAAEDRHLVDLVSTAMTDPNLHTDTRMRLGRDLRRVLRDAPRTHHARTEEEPDDDAPIRLEPPPTRLLEAALIDPNLHTDARMRLHREIPAMVRRARMQT